MQTVRLDEAQSRLPELVDSLADGNEILITRDDQPVAKLTGAAEPNVSTSLRDIQPASIGALLRPIFMDDDDLLGEMSAA
jgi:antitoxin (DNA-binding transcriptional repressor) of toxin-antitoxin stability system